MLLVRLGHRVLEVLWDHLDQLEALALLDCTALEVLQDYLDRLVYLEIRVTEVYLAVQESGEEMELLVFLDLKDLKVKKGSRAELEDPVCKDILVSKVKREQKDHRGYKE